MTTKDKLTKAKIQLILSQPFFATLILSLPLIEDASIDTASTNGSEIKYNAAFIDSLSIDEIKGLLCHEILHIANFHHTRREGRDIKTWNKATDYAINQSIIESGLKLPQGALIEGKYKGLSAEKIFAMLPAPAPEDKPGNKPAKDGEGNGPTGPTGPSGNFGEVEDGKAKTEGEKQEIEAKVKQKVAQAAQIAKRAGKLPAYLQRIIDEILQPKINWKEVLARFITDTARNDYSFKKPNPRFIQSGFYLPSLHNEEPGKIICIVDISGSVIDNMNLVNQFAGELQDVCNEIKSTLLVVYVNTEVTGTQEIEPDENVKLIFEGGGGTMFSPGFNYIDEQGLEPKAVVYLTDGECYEFPEPPDYPVLWAKYGNHNFKPPFGEVINI